MSKVQLVISDRYRLSIPVQSIRENRVGSMFRFIKHLGLNGLALSLLLLPALAVGSDLAFSEQIQFKLLILLGAFLALALVLLLWLGGKKQLIDPPGFLGVLVFAFLSISALLLVSVLSGSDSSTTFGSSGLRYLSSIALMSLSLLYYISVFLLDRFWKLKYIFAGVLGTLVISVLLSVLNVSYLQELAPILAVALPIFPAVAVLGSNRWVKMGAVVLGVVTAVLLVQPLRDVAFTTLPAYSTWSISRVTYIDQWAGLLVVPVLGLLVLAVMALKKNSWRVSLPWQVVQIRWKKYREGKLEIGDFLISVLPQVLFALSFIWLVFEFFFVVVNKIDVGDMISRVVLGYKKGLNGDLVTLLFGHGFASQTLVESYWANTLYVQGLVGLAAQLVLTGTGFIMLNDLIKLEMNSIKHLRLSYILAPIITAVPLMGIFLNLPLSLVILWWVALALLSATLIIGKRAVLVNIWKELYLWRFRLVNRLTLLQAIGMVLIIIVWCVVVSQLWIIIK